MRIFIKIVALISVMSVVSAALFVFYTDKEIILLKDGTIKTVDATWPSGNSIFYEIDNQIYFHKKDEIKTYGERNLAHFFLAIKNTVILKLNSLGASLNSSLDNIHYPLSINVTIALILVVVVLFVSLILMRSKLPAKAAPEVVDKQEHKVVPQELKNGVPNRLDIVRFFLNVFKYQIGAEPDAPVEYVPLTSKSSGSNHIYELRVKHLADWTKRRMTIGSLGEDSGSKSKCYYVIYDVHMVVKIPVRPISNFEEYIASIKKEVHIVNKLSPKECIIPKASVILGLIHSFPNSENTTPEKLEERYINWLRKSPEYQEYLKINNSFVFFMDLSKYYFLSHILDELHDIKNLITREITENAQVIWEPVKFKGRYGIENDVIFEIREIYNRCETEIRHLEARAEITTPVSIYQMQTWFFSHLASNQVSPNGAGYPESFISELNRMLKETMQANSKIVDVYRKLIKDFIYMSTFEQNKAQMCAVTVNLLDILAWFREKEVSMRDLKPDNLFVAGDPSKYPLFLRSAQEFSLGIIDVETAVDFEKPDQTEQPLLGGTPFYATPSHFIKNDVLMHKYKHLGKILHLQDWHATLVMIYKVITGELLFEQSAKLFADIRSMMIQANKPGASQTDVYEEASRIFWHNAIVEFQEKTDKSETALKSISVVMPETVANMFANVLAEEKKSIQKTIKCCVDSQNIFGKDQIREHLLRSSYEKICQFKADLNSKTKRSQNPADPRSEAINFLQKLADMKAILGQYDYTQELLSKAEAKVSVHDILTFMFNVVLTNMYRSEWHPLVGEAVHSCDVEDVPDEQTIIEATI